MNGKTLTSRRQFLTAATLTGTVAAASGVANAASPTVRTGKPYMKLSLAAYSFNRILKRRAPASELANAPMRLEDFVDYCAELDLDGCEPTAYYFPEIVTREYILKLKRQAFNLGLDISGTAIGNDFGLPYGPKRDEQLAMTREWIEHAALLGAPVIRIFAGNTPAGETDEAAIGRCVEGINESLKHAAQYGVFLALENHGGITSTPEQMLSIVAGVDDSPWFGVNLDSGNFRSDDPYRDLEKIAPYSVNVQIKVAVTRNGTKEESDFKRVIGILKDAGYRGYIVLEYEEREDPKTAIPRYIDRLRDAIG